MMLLLILVCLNILIFGTLAKIHFYWALGGQWGIKYTVPEVFLDRYNDPRAKNGIRLATITVSIGLLFFAFITASNYFEITNLFPHSYALIGTRVIGSIFILRAIGDFNHFGIFKKQKDTNFANCDTKYYVPICLVLASGSFLISYLAS